MALQNYLVKTMWMMTPSNQGGPVLTPDQQQQFGQMMSQLQQMTPAQLQSMPVAMQKAYASQYSQLLQAVQASNYGAYQYFTSNLNFNGLKGFFGSFSSPMQQVFMGLLTNAPGVYTPGYDADNNILYTNRLRLNFNAKVADNVSFTSRLTMYKAFGDSTGVQVFNGQPNTFAIDGATARVPSGDMLRVERAYFSWNHIGGSNMYFSIGRRPSTDGLPVNLRNDEPRGGTPMGSLFNYQYDGMTLGYHLTEKTALRACYGVGFDSGWGAGEPLLNQSNVKSVHLMGVMSDIIDTDKTFVQALYAHAWNVTDGFSGLMVMDTNPLTGDAIPPVVSRYSPTTNLGAINLYGLVVQKTLGPVDMFVSGNWDSLRPNGQTSPFGGLGSDPFETPVNHDGHMVYAGLRYNFPQNDGRTKIGFEFNQGSKYWFNFSQAEDDILMPKTATRGEVYEAYLTHRINDHFIFKTDYQRYNYRYSGSGWHTGTPKKLDSTPVLGYPTYDNANLFTIGLTARF